LLTSWRQLHSAWKDDVKNYIAAIIRFAPDAEIFCELIAQRAILMPVGADGQSDRRGRTHVGGAAHSAAEGFAQYASDRR